MAPHFEADDLNGVVVLPPTPARRTTDQLSQDLSVDLDESERMIRRLLEDGVDAILTNGTLGEMPTLSVEEWKSFSGRVLATVQSVDPDFPLFIGVTTLNTRDTLARIRHVTDLGARGVFVGRPFWTELPAAGIVKFYEDVCNSFPDVSLVLYDNAAAFKGPIPTDVYAELSELPQIVGSKYVQLTAKYVEDLEAVSGKIRLLPIDHEWMEAWDLEPESARGCWSSSALCGPEPVLFLRDALAAGNIDEARWITSRINWASEPFLARQNFPEFMKYNIPLEKVRFDEAGYVRAGWSRPPYNVVPEPYKQGARENARRWRSIVEEVQRKEPVRNELRNEPHSRKKAEVSRQA